MQSTIEVREYITNLTSKGYIEVDDEDAEKLHEILNFTEAQDADLISLQSEYDDVVKERDEANNILKAYDHVGDTTIDEPVFAGMISYRVDNLAMLSLMEEVVRVAKTGKIQLAIDLLKTIR